MSSKTRRKAKPKPSRKRASQRKEPSRSRNRNAKKRRKPAPRRGGRAPAKRRGPTQRELWPSLRCPRRRAPDTLWAAVREAGRKLSAASQPPPVKRREKLLDVLEQSQAVRAAVGRLNVEGRSLKQQQRAKAEEREKRPKSPAPDTGSAWCALVKHDKGALLELYTRHGEEALKTLVAAVESELDSGGWRLRPCGRFLSHADEFGSGTWGARLLLVPAFSPSRQPGASLAR